MREEGRGFTRLVGAADAAPPMLAMDEPPISIDGVAVDEIRGVDHRLDVTVRIPSEHPAAVDIGPDEPLAGRIPDDAFAKCGVLVEAKQRRVRVQDVKQARTVNDSLVRIAQHLRRTGTPQQGSRHASVPHCSRSTALSFRGAPKVLSSSATYISPPIRPKFLRNSQSSSRPLLFPFANRSSCVQNGW